MKILIRKTGEIEYIYSDELAALSRKEGATIRRVSNVEPSEGGWTAYMKDGTILGPYKLRSEALAKEVKYLEEKLFGEGMENGTTKHPV